MRWAAKEKKNKERGTTDLDPKVKLDLKTYIK